MPLPRQDYLRCACTVHAGHDAACCLREQHALGPAGVQAPRLRRLLAYLVITHRLVVRPLAPAPPGEEEAYGLIEQLECYEREEPPLAQEDSSFSQVG